MFTLPPSLGRHFRDSTGRTDFLRLLRTPDERLIELARGMPEAEWAGLYADVRHYRLGFLERMAAAAAGVDPEEIRRRFLRVLEQATPATV